MTIKKTLLGLGLVGALALAGCGCKNACKKDPLVVYDSMIGKDKVTYVIQKYPYSTSDNLLTVKKEDGRVIFYEDAEKNDLKLEKVTVTKGRQTCSYTLDDEVGQMVLEEAQTQFESYLAQIYEIRLKEGMDGIKK